MPALRWRRASPAWLAKPSTLMASTGNTHGIRLSSRPPMKAPSSATMKLPAVADVGVATGLRAASAALAASAACSAGETVARGGALGQTPVTGASARHAMGWPGWRSAAASVTTTGISVGLALRWSASGMVALQVAPFHAWVQSLPETAAVRITSPVSGKKPSVLPCAMAGRPSRRTFSVLPCTSIVPGPASGTGCAASAASKPALSSAVEPCTGSFR